MDRIEAYLDTLLMRLTLIKDRPYVSVSASLVGTDLILLQEEWLGRSGNRAAPGQRPLGRSISCTRHP